MAQIRVHGVVTGLVQGVNFRWSMQQQANRLGVGGWVRNRADGRVEFEAEGSDEAVSALVSWAHTGPAAGYVERVDTHRVATVADGAFRIA